MVNTLRAKKGNTSSDEIFWLMPAMRRNDRKGPEMTTPFAKGDNGVTTAGEFAFDAGTGEETSGTVLWAWANGQKHKRPAMNRVGRQRDPMTAVRQCGMTTPQSLH